MRLTSARMLPETLPRSNIKGREELTVEVGPVVGTYAGPWVRGRGVFLQSRGNSVLSFPGLTRVISC